MYTMFSTHLIFTISINKVVSFNKSALLKKKTQLTFSMYPKPYRNDFVRNGLQVGFMNKSE